MRFRALMFDLDGTLLDSLADLGQSMNTVLAAMGYPGHPPDLLECMPPGFCGDFVPPQSYWRQAPASSSPDP